MGSGLWVVGGGWWVVGGRWWVVGGGWCVGGMSVVRCVVVNFACAVCDKMEYGACGTVRVGFRAWV